MQYRRLGRSGLKVSELSLGSWVTYHNQVDTSAAHEMMAAAFDVGVNFFDNAEVYAAGQSEVVMGQAIKALKWPRLNYIVSTKFFWGLDRDGQSVNRRDTLNRKYLMQAIDAPLTCMGLDFIDLVYCHRSDPNTPIEETVWSMSNMISRGKALYWGTSEWSADEIRIACNIAERHHLHKPVMEQPQYNLFHRKRVEQESKRLIEDTSLGLTTWSPLVSGLLIGKYRNGVPAGSRSALEGMGFLVKDLTDAPKNAAVADLESIATELGCNLGQLAIAWAAPPTAPAARLSAPNGMTTSKHRGYAFQWYALAALTAFFFLLSLAMANHLETRETAYRDTIQGGRFKLLLLFLVCAAPVLASYFTFYIVKPEQRANYGELAKVAPLPDAALTLLDGKPFRISEFKGKWVLLTFDGGACADACIKKLYNMRQVRTALGKERERVERAWLVTDAAPLDTMTMREYDGTRMLRFPKNAEPARMKKDLNRLLKYSRIG